METIGEILLPAVEGYQEIRFRGGRVLRGKLNDSDAQARKALSKQLKAFPGTHTFENIDDETFVTCQEYPGLPRTRWWLHALLLVLTAFTTTFAYSDTVLEGIFRLPEIVLKTSGDIATRLGAAWAFLSSLPFFTADGMMFSAAILGILLAHECGHYFAALRYGMSATPPFFIPVPFGVGTMGAIIRIRTPMLHRRSLLDIGAAGPIAGLVVAITVLALGFHFAPYVPAGDIAPDAFRARLGDSILSSSLRWLIKDPRPTGYMLAAHPFRLAGWFGLIVTALNLLPVGQLDGGHCAYALFGRRQRALGFGTLAALLLLGSFGAASMAAIGLMPALADVLPQAWPMWFIVALLVGFVMRRPHPPVMFPDVPLGRTRSVVAIGMLVTLVVCFAPSPFDLWAIFFRG